MISGACPGGQDSDNDTSMVTGYGQSVRELAHEVTSVLADGPGVVVCDLTAAEPSASEAVEVLRPVTRYLAEWPGTGLVVVCAPQARAGFGTWDLPGGVVFSESADDGVRRLRARLPSRRRVHLHLGAQLTAPRTARHFTAQALLRWRLMPLVGPACLAVSELVTNAVVHAASDVDLTLTHAGDRLQVSVRDHGVGTPDACFDDPGHLYLRGRGLLLVQGVTCGWGVFPARPAGKTVWALFDTAQHRGNVITGGR